MDALSDVLRVVGLTGGVFLDAEFTEPWSVAGKVAPEMCRPFMVQPERVVCFHYVSEGACRIRLEDGAEAEVRAGQVVMLPRNDLHVLSGGARTVTVHAGELVQAPGTLGVGRINHGGGGARTRMVCGFLGGGLKHHPLLDNLPPLMIVDLASLAVGDWMGRTFSYAAQTLAEGDPGAATVLAKLSELLFVEAVRRYVAALPPERTGWLAALRDLAVGRAMALMHGQVDRDWTTEALAREAHLSRSAFAERFTGLIGVPPMRYLLNWRMLLARQKLQDTRQSVAQIAFAVGYESEAAFSRAFHREVGQPPATWRRGAEGR